MLICEASRLSTRMAKIMWLARTVALKLEQLHLKRMMFSSVWRFSATARLTRGQGDSDSRWCVIIPNWCLSFQARNREELQLEKPRPMVKEMQLSVVVTPLSPLTQHRSMLLHLSQWWCNSLRLNISSHHKPERSSKQQAKVHHAAQSCEQNQRKKTS